MKKLFIAISLLLLLVSCNDDIKSNESNHIDIATVENPNLSTAFYFRLDNGDLMYTNTADLLNYKPKDGQRIIANYSFIETNPAANSVVKNIVKLNDFYEVLTKGIFKIKPQQQDSIGNDQIEIKSMWIGSDYLNVEFEYLGLSKMHYISLVSDSTKTFSDNRIHLEFRHNANGDYPTYSKWGIASFNLRSIRVSNSSVDSVKLAIHTREYATPADKTYPLTYKFTLITPQLSVTKVAFPMHSEENIH
jgi:hypothetical protein